MHSYNVMGKETNDSCRLWESFLVDLKEKYNVIPITTKSSYPRVDMAIFTRNQFTTIFMSFSIRVQCDSNLY